MLLDIVDGFAAFDVELGYCLDSARPGLASQQRGQICRSVARPRRRGDMPRAVVPGPPVRDGRFSPREVLLQYVGMGVFSETGSVHVSALSVTAVAARAIIGRSRPLVTPARSLVLDGQSTLNLGESLSRLVCLGSPLTNKHVSESLTVDPRDSRELERFLK